MTPPLLSERSAGLLLPLASLPSRFGAGDLGTAAFHFVDFLHAAGCRWWQMLPIGPLGFGNSPYDSASAFAGDPLYISLEGLQRAGWLASSDLRRIPRFPKSRVNYNLTRSFREPLLRRAFERFRNDPRPKPRNALSRFIQQEHYWLNDFCLFVALTQEHRSSAWMDWEPGLRMRRAPAIREATRRLTEEIAYQAFLQWQFDVQWHALREYAARRQVRLIGDVAIFVSHQSADVWSHAELFQLNAKGHPRNIAGVPPDYFSKDGQRWGNPLYRWDRMAADDYRWWTERLRQALKRFDAIRLDHFIGFYRYWQIPANSPTAKNGQYRPGPGASFFNALKKKLGPLPFIAEDLGVVTPEVKALRERFGFPGMKVLQFAFGDDPEADNYQPHRYGPNSVAYTGTHDNDTLSGWWNDDGTGLSTRSPEEIRRERTHTLQYLGCTAKDVEDGLLRLLWASVANIAIAPAQDILKLGTEARTNRPGTSEGNWRWRLRPHDLSSSIAKELRKVSILYDRASQSDEGGTMLK